MNNKRLIDADALKCRFLAFMTGAHTTYLEDHNITMIVNQAPTVDAVEVVRCRDCKHWNYGDCYRLELSMPDDFCSYGERKEG